MLVNPRVAIFELDKGNAMKKLGRLTAALAFALVAGNATAGTLYTVNESGNVLESIDTTTLVKTTIGATGVAAGRFGDLAYDEVSGTMYWVAGRGNDNLYKLNLATGAATLIGSHGIGDEFTLGWNGTKLFGQSTSGNVYTFNTGTGAATLIGSNSVYPGGYDYNPNTGQLVLLNAGPGSFYSINQTNGAATLLNAGAGFVNDDDLAYDAGLNAYWVIDYSGFLYKYDATTYTRTTSLSGLGEHAALELVTVAAVDEPGTLALFGIAVAWMVASRRRKTVA